MIRLAEQQDIKIIVELLKEFLTATAYPQAERALKNTHNLIKIARLCIERGQVWLAFDQDRAVGLLAAVREPNLWVPEIEEMRELIWFVIPEYRNSLFGGRLLKAYQKSADAMIKSGEISVYFVGHMTSTAAIDLERRGFRLTELTYIKES